MTISPKQSLPLRFSEKHFLCISQFARFHHSNINGYLYRCSALFHTLNSLLIFIPLQFHLLNTCALICKYTQENTLENHFKYLGNKQIYCIFKTRCIISVLFSTKYHLLHNFIFFFSNNIFFINHVLKFKYPAQYNQVKYVPENFPSRHL